MRAEEVYAILKKKIEMGGGGGSGTVSMASRDRLGGVRIGENINIDEDGTISVDMETLKRIMLEDLTASDEEVKKMLEDVLNSSTDNVSGK